MTYGNGTDLGQPFTMSGTTIGRVAIPVLPAGAGADMLVSLWPDNGSGNPNTSGNPLASVSLPAAVLGQLAAPQGLTAAGRLASANYNSGYLSGGVTTSPYPVPAAGASGVSVTSSFACSGNFAVSVGGQDPSTSAATAGVNTFEYVGGGALAPPTPQQSLPVGTNGAAVAIANGFLVVIGGGTGVASATVVSSVWAASWDGNTGSIGSWSAQAALPAVSQLGSMVGYGEYVYYIGGNTGFAFQAATYYAQVNNGQISSWLTGPPLPVTLMSPMTAAVNGWLFVIGGVISSLAVVSTVYYAAINADGSLGPWQTGPALPAANQAFGPGFDLAVADDLIVIIGGAGTGGLSLSTVTVLAVTAAGPGDNWVSSNWGGTRFFPVFAFGTGGGSYDIVAVNLNAVPTQTESSTLVSVPVVSVPVNATGLTNGSVYHIVLQQHQTGTASDYLSWPVLPGALPISGEWSQRHSGTWTNLVGYSMPIAVYSASATGDLYHLAAEPNGQNVTSAWTTLLFNNMNLLVGEVDTTLLPNNPLDSNPTFTSGVGPWTATGGTITQSAAQTQGGFPFSGLLTPNGVAVQAFAQSELLPVVAGTNEFYGNVQWYLADGWFYSPPGTTNFSSRVNWYDRLGNYLSTSSSTMTLVAATWTHVQNYVEAPAGAAFASLVPTEGGTPASSKLLYISNLVLVQAPECVGSFSSAATVNYGTPPWPPTGVTQLI
ncbi:Kelch repeat-containing protein [Streptacidiphilus sp. PAMC 29251]